MEKKHESSQCLINRFASVLYRCSRSFYDQYLKPYNISSGMHFFLLRINENSGITTMELSEKARFDKGTTTRAVKKLERQGYIKITVDDKDKRIRHHYLTEKAVPVLHASFESLYQWEKIITSGLEKPQIKQAEELMRKIAENAYQYIKGI
ncbi:MAG: MarR family winged helix-turn-helix transcriptional regulator [Treponema sp.]|jgi:DNA-binding MarR family transcriptional regulator|nr:MarR family winged helix-turn-helix transcriptional regulator [Treponema sp.]